MENPFWVCLPEKFGAERRNGSIPKRVIQQGQHVSPNKEKERSSMTIKAASMKKAQAPQKRAPFAPLKQSPASGPAAEQ